MGKSLPSWVLYYILAEIIFWKEKATPNSANKEFHQLHSQKYQSQYGYDASN